MPALRSSTRNLCENTAKFKRNSDKNRKPKISAQNCEVKKNPKRKHCDKIHKGKDIDSGGDDGFVEIGDRSNPRKRRDPSKWKRNILGQLKRDDYEKQYTSSVSKCVHKKGHFKCDEISHEDVYFIRKIFARHTKPIDQNRYILSQVVVDSVKRHRQRNSSRSQKSVAPSFFLRLKSAKRIRVCKVAFGTVLGVGRGRLTKLIHFYNVCRLYLPHELKSIKNLCRIYNANQDDSMQVKYGLFRGIFKRRFNLAFGTPRTDVCSFCLRNKHQLLVEKDPYKKQLIRGQLRIHKLRYQAFYKLLKNRQPHLKTLAADCQQNQPLPKIPDQAAYFSRQLNLYNFTIAEYMGEDETLNFAYIWTEERKQPDSQRSIPQIDANKFRGDLDCTLVRRWMRRAKQKYANVVHVIVLAHT